MTQYFSNSFCLLPVSSTLFYISVEKNSGSRKMDFKMDMEIENNKKFKRLFLRPKESLKINRKWLLKKRKSFLLFVQEFYMFHISRETKHCLFLHIPLHLTQTELKKRKKIQKNKLVCVFSKINEKRMLQQLWCKKYYTQNKILAKR